MNQPSAEDLKWITDIEARSLAIQKHIPIRAVELIISDYAAVVKPSLLTNQKCLHCYAHHKRRISSLCSNCTDVCVICTKRTTKNEKTLVCDACIQADRGNFTIATSQGLDKSQLYAAWHSLVFPSEIERNHAALVKRELADPVKQASIAEAKRIETEFYAIENAKHPWLQVTELRAKLWAVYREVNAYKANNPGAKGLSSYPEFPLY